MYEAQVANQDNVLGKVAQYQSVLTQNVFCVRVFGIIFLCPRMVGELVFLATTSISSKYLKKCQKCNHKS